MILMQEEQKGAALKEPIRVRKGIGSEAYGRNSGHCKDKNSSNKTKGGRLKQRKITERMTMRGIGLDKSSSQKLFWGVDGFSLEGPRRVFPLSRREKVASAGGTGMQAWGCLR